MSEFVSPMAEWAAAIVEMIGVCVIVLLVLGSLGHAALQLVQRVDGQTIFRETRRRLAQGILLGLEFLVAADIIHTVAVELTFASIGVLAVIVVIRTFLSYSLGAELTGRGGARFERENVGGRGPRGPASHEPGPAS